MKTLTKPTWKVRKSGGGRPSVNLSTTNKVGGMSYILTLEHAKNPDIDDERSGYWQEPVTPKKVTMEIRNLRDARSSFKSWRDANGLGGGNMTQRSGRVALYYRVSTKTQTTEPQRLELLEYCQRREWSNPREYSDKMSGAKWTRIGFEMLMADVRKHRVDVVVCVKMDRSGGVGSRWRRSSANWRRIGARWYAHRSRSTRPRITRPGD
jgi:hypothetical protein